MVFVVVAVPRIVRDLMVQAMWRAPRPIDVIPSLDPGPESEMHRGVGALDAPKPETKEQATRLGVDFAFGHFSCCRW